MWHDWSIKHEQRWVRWCRSNTALCLHSWVSQKYILRVQDSGHIKKSTTSMDVKEFWHKPDGFKKEKHPTQKITTFQRCGTGPWAPSVPMGVTVSRWYSGFWNTSLSICCWRFLTTAWLQCVLGSNGGVLTGNLYPSLSPSVPTFENCDWQSADWKTFTKNKSNTLPRKLKQW